MYDKLYELIEQAFSDGIPPHLIADGLVTAGWPETLVHQALDSWLQKHGRLQKSTAFKDWIKKYHSKALPAVIAVVFINVINVAISLLAPWPTKILADSAFGGFPAPGPLEPYTGTATLILITSGMTLALFILGTIFGTIRDFMLLKIGYWLNKAIKQESMRHIMHLPLFHQERLSKGDYVYRQNVVTNSLSDLVLGTTSSIAESLIVIVGVLVIMLTLNVTLTIVSIVLIPFLFVSMKLIGPKLGETAQELTEVASETSSRINESVDNAETVQAFTLEEKLLGRITQLWDRGYELSKRNLFWGELLNSSNGLLIVLATSTVMYIGGSAALNGELLLGELLVLMTYMGYLLDPVENLISQITSRNQKIIDVNRIYEVLADHEGIEYLRKDDPMPAQITGRIEFKNVTYSYKDTAIFQNLNLVIEPGQKIAIIGPSGSGKSTILKLLPLFIEPDSGRISIDSSDIQSVSLKDLRRHISWVSQTPQLFEGNIIDNLTDGDSEREVSNEEVMNAIETANVTEFATKLPLGLASPTGENGSALSGGQRQRISIARALIKNSPIVCLDEPTAALDAKSENLIRDSLLQMIEGKTVMMVTHRKSLLTLMDVVYVLDDGKLTDVNELGGLNTYLAQLEGLEEEKAVQEIQQDSAHIGQSDNLMQQYSSVVGGQQPSGVVEIVEPYPDDDQPVVQQDVYDAEQDQEIYSTNDSNPVEQPNIDVQQQFTEDSQYIEPQTERYYQELPGNEVVQVDETIRPEAEQTDDDDPTVLHVQ